MNNFQTCPSQWIKSRSQVRLPRKFIMRRIQINLPFSVHCIITNLKIGNIDTDLHKVTKNSETQLIDGHIEKNSSTLKL